MFDLCGKDDGRGGWLIYVKAPAAWVIRPHSIPTIGASRRVHAITTVEEVGGVEKLRRLSFD